MHTILQWFQAHFFEARCIIIEPSMEMDLQSLDTNVKFVYKTTKETIK